MTKTLIDPDPYANLTMIKFAYNLYQTLGGMTSILDTRGELLRSYEFKRDFFTDKMYSELLDAFTGHYTPKKEGTPKVIEKQISPQHDKIQTMFDYLFKRIEEIIFLMQRSYDLAFYEKYPFHGSFYICAAIVVISKGLAENSNQYVKTSPLIYLKSSILEIANNNFNIVKTIKKTISKHLSELSEKYPANSLSFHQLLNKISQKKHLTSLPSVSTTIQKLRDELKGPFKNPLTAHQENKIQEIQGTYNCLLALSRLQSSFVFAPYEDTDDIIRLLYDFIKIEDKVTLSSKNPDLQNTVPIHDGSRQAFMMDLYLATYDYIWNNQKDPFKASRTLQGFPKFITKLEYLSFTNISSLTNQLISISINYPEATKLVNCLRSLHKNNHEKAAEFLSVFLPCLDTAPYSLRRLTCVLHVGLSLSKSFKITPNELDEYIAIYLETSCPTLDMYIGKEELKHKKILVYKDASYQYEESLKKDKIRYKHQKSLIDKYQSYKYDRNHGLVHILYQYNHFIINSAVVNKNINVDTFIVNPLSSINSFFETFFINFDKIDVTHDFERSKAALKGIKTPLRHAKKASIIDFDLIDLKSNLILELLGLAYLKLSAYKGTASINRFLRLPEPTQEAILDACEEELDAMFPKKKE